MKLLKGPLPKIGQVRPLESQQVLFGIEEAVGGPANLIGALQSIHRMIEVTFCKARH